MSDYEAFFNDMFKTTEAETIIDFYLKNKYCLKVTGINNLFRWHKSEVCYLNEFTDDHTDDTQVKVDKGDMLIEIDIDPVYKNKHEYEHDTIYIFWKSTYTKSFFSVITEVCENDDLYKNGSHIHYYGFERKLIAHYQ